ncbi:hypothetical protein [Cupriavidus plantarum]|uniref:hypothetical protein n=1 Tax=Cupriavidus plantarum TaxID=942865 RepID=UPI00339D9D15
MNAQADAAARDARTMKFPSILPAVSFAQDLGQSDTVIRAETNIGAMKQAVSTSVQPQAATMKLVAAHYRIDDPGTSTPMAPERQKGRALSPGHSAHIQGDLTPTVSRWPEWTCCSRSSYAPSAAKRVWQSL